MPAPKREGVFLIFPNGDHLVDHEGIKIIHRMRKENRLDEIERLLSRAVATPAVANEYRLNYSARAQEAKKNGDWKLVVQYLELYTRYADSVRDRCVRAVNQEPPPHTPRDQGLLEEARRKIENN